MRKLITLEIARRFLTAPIDGVDQSATHLAVAYGLRISVPAAKALACFDGELPLYSLTTLEPRVARELAKHQGTAINLAGLRHLQDDVAEILSDYRGSLNLDGLTELSETAAKFLSLHRGSNLHLCGLKTLSEAAANCLAQHQGTLWLIGLSEKPTSGNGRIRLSSEAARALTVHPRLRLDYMALGGPSRQIWSVPLTHRKLAQ